MILNLFSLPVCKTNLLGSSVDFDSLRSTLSPIFEESKMRNADLEQNGGISTYWIDSKLHLRPEFKLLAEQVLQEAKLYWKVLDICDNLNPEIEECWSNIHPPGGYTSQHSHSLMPMVASFYLDAPPHSGDIVLTNPMEYSLTHIPYNSAIETKTETAVHIQTGDLLFFPGWVRHKTQVNLSNNNRIVITFNIKYKGEYLSSQSPYPNIRHSSTSDIDTLTNEIYRQQKIIEQLQRVIK